MCVCVSLFYCYGCLVCFIWYSHKQPQEMKCLYKNNKHRHSQRYMWTPHAYPLGSHPFSSVLYYVTSVSQCLKHNSPSSYLYIYIYIYTECPRRKGPNFGRVFLRSNYTDITQNTYIQSSMVTEILAREIWNFNRYYSLIDYQIHIETGRNMWFL